MSGIPSASLPDRVSPTQARALALWTFVASKTARFTTEAALELINELGHNPTEDHRSLAKRIRKALESRGIALKHSHALQAAARVSGHSSWHTDADASTPRLRFTSIDEKINEAEFVSWDELTATLRSWVDKLHANGQLPSGVLSLRFTRHAISLETPSPRADNEPGEKRNEIWAVGTITSLTEEEDWLSGAPAAIEKLRRHLEETGKAVVDGCAVLQLCANSCDRPGDINAVTAIDVVNSELVLIREDNEDDPHSGYEIARGDELTCWHQLEISLRDDRTNVMPAIDVTIPDEGSGAWFVNGNRYIWALETLKPNEYLPGRVHRVIGIADCKRMLRRYKFAKRIHSGEFKHHSMIKRVDYLGGPPEDYRVNLHHVLHLLKEADLTWEGYIEKFEAEPLEMQAKLPVGFVLEMLKNLQVGKPNKVFATPNLSEMARIENDGLLRSLMPRVDTVRYVQPKNLDETTAQSLQEIVEEFATASRVHKMVAAGSFRMENELPHLVYASDPEDFRVATDRLGLVAYVGVVPHLFSIPEDMLKASTLMHWPWAVGHALFVRFERLDGVQ